MMTMLLSVASGRSLSTPPRNRAQEIGQHDGRQLAHLGHRPGPLVDRRLREPTGRWHRPEEGAGDARHAVGGELLVVVDRRLRAAADRLGDGCRLQEAHDGDGEGARQQVADVVERWGHRDRQPGRDRRDEGDAVLVDRGEGDEGDADATATSGPGTVGAHRRSPSRMASVSAEKAAVVQLMSPRSSMMPRTSATTFSRLRVAVDAEQLRQLAEGHGDPDADLDAGDRRLGDVVDQRPEAEHPGGEQDQPDEQREHGQVARRIGARRRRSRRRAGWSR